ncbi:MAG: GNAT family N-acetyltransferase [Deltaproteobacteria bacterium]|jgi:GNAT superfamily N-acetyltransferase|nr:GNAT family N-acetyltransferase [Deltaproteobacteria bacterium]
MAEATIARKNEAAARILAATLTLISREQKTLPPPFSLWTPPMGAKEIKEAALAVASGGAQVIWVEESHPARGLALLQRQEIESELLGGGAGRLKGPFLVDPEASSRQEKTFSLATKAKWLAKGLSYRFLSVKSVHDPAIIRGYNEAGFQAAEITTRLGGPIAPADPQSLGTLKNPGVTLARAQGGEGARLLKGLGDLFYDGHYLHGPSLPPDFSRRLWAKVAEEALTRGDLALFALDPRAGEPVGLALASQNGAEAYLLILHVAEEKRREGLGRFLLLNLLSELWRAGARTLKAETASWNLPALSLYLGVGLKPAASLVALHHALN